MSELREHLFVPYSELQKGDELTDAITIAKSYYLKSEVDTAIAEKDAEIAKLKGQVNGFQNRSSLWHYNAVEEHKKFVQAGAVIAEKDKEIAKLKEQVALLQEELTENREYRNG